MIRDRRFFILDPIKTGRETETLFPIENNVSEITTPIWLRITKDTPNTEIARSNHVLTVDARKIEFPLLLRKWRYGDWFVPFGMRGKKKLSDYFTDRKMSLQEKENVWILLSGEQIVWVVGLRADNRFRVTDETKEVLVLTLLER